MVKKLPQIVDLPWRLQWLLFKEFSVYVLRSIRFRHYVMAFSICALAYQTDMLADAYLEYLTVVKVDIIKPDTVQLPGTTICTDKYHVVLKSALERKYPELLDDVERVKQDLVDRNITEQQSISNAIMDVYRAYRERAQFELLIGEWFELVVKPEMFLNCTLWIKPKYHVKRNLSMPTCEQISLPIYHLANGAGVCWTYFSQINRNSYHKSADKPEFFDVDVPEEGRVASFKFSYTVFDDFAYDEMPYTVENEDKSPEYYVTTHHPKTVPSMISLDRAVARAGTKFEILFQQTNSHVLQWPFETDCKYYENTTLFEDWKSSDHCLDECLSYLVAQDCNCIFNESSGGRITKWDAPYNTTRFCNETHWSTKPEAYPEKHLRPSKCHFRGKYEQWSSICGIKGRCNTNCYEEYYRYEVRHTLLDDQEEPNGSMTELGNLIEAYTRIERGENASAVTITRRDTADISYEHMPEMIFVEFACYFGGLLGLWLGVSLLDCYGQYLIWCEVGPIQYKKWLDKQMWTTDVEPFTNDDSKVKAEVTSKYNGNITYLKNHHLRDSIYNTKY